MKYSVLCVVLVAALLSSTFLDSVESAALRFGRTIKKRKLGYRARSHEQMDESYLPSKQRETGSVNNAYIPSYIW